MTRRALRSITPLVLILLSVVLSAVDEGCRPPVPPPIDGGDSGLDAAPSPADAGSDVVTGCPPPPMPPEDAGEPLPPPPAANLREMATLPKATTDDICPKPAAKGAARCLSKVVRTTGVLGDARPVFGALVPSGYGPKQIHGAYALPSTGASGQAVAIVVAYDHPTSKADLDNYSRTYGIPVLPACDQCGSQACYMKVNQDGNASPLPPADPGWALEAAMDVQQAHQICQSCKIILVEARSSYFSDLAKAVDTAARLGATVISNSYGGGDTGKIAAYDKPTVAIVASSGDEGYAAGAESPASFDSVVAVGGTSLYVDAASGAWMRETAWSGAGSGCSSLNAARTWQTSTAGWAAGGCGTRRGVSDVAAVADPATGAAVYDSTPYGGQSGWFVLGGTSLSAPIVAGIYGLRGDARSVAYAAQLTYARRAYLRDVTTGSNGSCSTTICKGSAAWDGPTGLGTPYGTTAF